MELLIYALFVVWLEVNEPPSEICTSPHIKALPEMCHAHFNRE